MLSYFGQYLVQSIGVALAVGAGLFFVFFVLKRLHSQKMTIVFAVIIVGVFIAFIIPNGLPRLLAYPFFLRTVGPSAGPELSLPSITRFITKSTDFERVANIARDPKDVFPDHPRRDDGVVEITLTAKEVMSEMADGVVFNYWTFDGTVPGPFLRVSEGDTISLTLRNDPTSLHHHSIDLHAVTGPGGGAAATIVAPGESKTITFKAMHPGLFIYHCAHPNVANHMAHGMYGLILVEPKEGLPPVDAEFALVQGEFYSAGVLGRKGLQLYDPQAMLDGKPTYVVFNGKTGSLVDTMKVNVGDTVRLYVGNGGVNLISSFHVIGEVFDRVYREGDVRTSPARSVQTTLIPAGGATVVDFKVDYPGKYILVDHALSRMDRGAWGVLEVVGEADPHIFNGEIQSGHGH